MIAIAELAAVVLDRPGTVALDEFYRQLTGWSAEPDPDPADPIDLADPVGHPFCLYLV